MRDRIENLIEMTAKACIPWIREKDGVIQFVDPIDQEEISAHYGATHAAGALIIYGKEKNNERTIKQGEDLLFSVLDRWEENKALSGFHNDFNNFALCALDSYTKDYHDRIREVVLGTTDSNHDTVNWLPMRWYVNKCRYEWTEEQKYKDACDSCEEKIRLATFTDGFIDDRLPKGMSFNLQYDVATVAVMQFLRTKGEKVDLSEQTGALLNAVCPDGDINYLGRGTNQIFAWGLWIYLLASSKQKELDRALKYLEDRLPKMLDNHNLMLNDYPGEEKYMWWDYHYCSVYTAHFLLWLVLAWLDFGKSRIEPELVEDGSSGVHIFKNDNAFVVTFDGRSEYLSERGPMVAAIWTNNNGVICKGGFGPWQGAFGNNYIQPELVLRNYTGLTSVTINKDYSKNRIIRRLFRNKKPHAKEEIKPVFRRIKVNIDSGVKINWEDEKSSRKIVNLVAYHSMESAQISVNGQFLNANMIIKTQYGWKELFQSKMLEDSSCTLVIS